MGTVTITLGTGVKVKGTVEATTTVRDSLVVESVASVCTRGISPAGLGEVLLEDVEDREERIADAGLSYQRKVWFRARRQVNFR